MAGNSASQIRCPSNGKLCTNLIFFFLKQSFLAWNVNDVHFVRFLCTVIMVFIGWLGALVISLYSYMVFIGWLGVFCHDYCLNN